VRVYYQRHDELPQRVCCGSSLRHRVRQAEDQVEGLDLDVG